MEENEGISRTALFSINRAESVVVELLESGLGLFCV